MRRLLLALALAGCGSPPTKVEANLAGDAGAYNGLKVCITVNFQDKKSQSKYPKDLCSDAPVAKQFQATVTGQADDVSKEIYSSAGSVFLRANTMEINGAESARSEEAKGDTELISVAIKF